MSKTAMTRREFAHEFRPPFQVTESDLMTTRSFVPGLTIPSDFPAGEMEAVHNKVAGRGTPKEAACLLGALNAIVYRFVSLTEYDERVRVSINAHGTDRQPFRYEQERDLFGFFSNGFSVFDACCFALFVIGAIRSPSNFPLATDRDERSVNWQKTRLCFGRAFPGDPILAKLDTVTGDFAFKISEIAAIF